MHYINFYMNDPSYTFCRHFSCFIGITHKLSNLHFSNLITQSHKRKGDVFSIRFCRCRCGGVKSSNLTPESSHHLLKAPVVSNSKRVYETLIVLDVSVKFVETDVFHSVKSSTLAQPFTSDLFPDGAGCLQWLTCNLKLETSPVPV